MDLHLMGDVEIQDGDRTVLLPRAGERCVLASLALEPRRRLHVDTLVDRVWGDDPPRNAAETIASYVRTVRRAIEDGGGQRQWLRNHRPAAYQLAIDPALVDYHRFAALVTRADARQRDRNPAEAAALYREAVELRTAEALGNVTGQWAANRRYAIEQEYLDAVCALYEQQLRIGEYAAVATHATRLVLDIVPTDRMIALALHGLAGTGQHAAIPGFLSRATERMWDAVEARPSSQVRFLARQLVASPDARLPPQQAGPDGAEPPARPGEGAPAGTVAAALSLVDGSGRRSGDRVPGGSVTMVAEHNRQVYQSASDQYITGA